METRHWVAAFGLIMPDALSSAANVASVFVAGHDQIRHAAIGRHTAGATNLARTGIKHVPQGSAAKFRYVEAQMTPVPSGSFQTAPFPISVLGCPQVGWGFPDQPVCPISMSRARNVMDLCRFVTDT